MSETENGLAQSVVATPLGGLRGQTDSPLPGKGESGRQGSPARPEFSAIQMNGVSAALPAPPKLPDYLGCSIFAAMFCFLPLGIAALVYSMKIWSVNQAGTTAAVRKNLMISRQLNIGAVLIGLIVHFVWIARLIITIIERT